MFIDIEALAQGAEPAPRPGWLIPARDIGLHVKPPVWLHKSVIMSDTVGVVYGPSGVGKSFFMLDLVTDLALAGEAIYFAFEGAWGYERRLTALRTRHPTRSIDHLSFVFDPFDVMNEGMVQEVIDGLLPIKPRIIVIDTLAQSMVGAVENDAGAMGSAVRALHALRRGLDGCTILAVHHTGKDGVTDRGSSALIGNVDFAIQLFDEDGVVRVEPKKVKDGPPFVPYHFALEASADSMVAVPASASYLPTVLTPTQLAVLRTLARTIFEEGARDQTLAEFTGAVKRTVQMALSHLLDNGCVEKGSKADSYKITPKGKTRLTYVLPGGGYK